MLPNWQVSTRFYVILPHYQGLLGLDWVIIDPYGISGGNRGKGPLEAIGVDGEAGDEEDFLGDPVPEP